MRLYYAPGASSLAVHIALREVGAAFELVRADLASSSLVPTLVLPYGAQHTGAASLLQLVADLEPSRRLIGAPGTARRFAVMEWLIFVAASVHGVADWLFRPAEAGPPRAVVRVSLTQRCRELERFFAANDWLAEEFSVADAYAFTVLTWVRVALSMRDYPNLERYLSRVAARPRVREALAAEGIAA